MSLPSLRLALLAGPVAALALAACGGDDLDPKSNAGRMEEGSRAVGQVVDDLGRAARDGDAGEICDELFTTKLAQALARTSGSSCEAQVRKQLVREGEEIKVLSYAVRGNQATALVREQTGNRSGLRFEQDNDGRWRIGAIEQR